MHTEKRILPWPLFSSLNARYCRETIQICIFEMLYDVVGESGWIAKFAV